MAAVFSRLTDRQFFVFCVGSYLILSFSLFLAWPVRWPDEVHFADVSRTLAGKGYLGTNLIAGMEHHMYWQPPLYFIVSALVIKLVGFHLEALRAFSILIGVGILFATGLLTRRLSNDPIVFRLSVLFLALNPLFVNYTKLARMDGLCVLLILLGVISIQGERQSKWIAGLFFSLASVTHFMGGVALIAVVIRTFLYEEKSKRLGSILAVIAPVVIALGIWSLYIFQDPQSFLLQMRFQFDRKSLALDESLMQFVKSFWSIPVWFGAMLLSLILVKRTSSQQPSLMLFILLIANLLVVGLAYEFSYQLYVLPYAAISVALLAANWWRSERRVLRISAWTISTLIVVNFLLYFAYFNYVVHTKLSKATDYQAIVAEVEQRLAPESKVLLSGYPSLFWGLNESSKSLRFVEPVILSPEMKDHLLDDVRYIVFTRAHNPVKDSEEFLDQLVTFSQLCRQRDLELKPIAGFGIKQEYAYSAELFEVVPAKKESESL